MSEHLEDKTIEQLEAERRICRDKLRYIDHEIARRLLDGEVLEGYELTARKLR